MRKQNRAFTLIELLVVVLIIGILAAIAVPQYQKAVEKSHATGILAQLKTLVEAEKIYVLTNGEYSLNYDDLEIGFNGRVSGIYKIQQNWYFSLDYLSHNPPCIFAARTYRVLTSEEERYYFVYNLANDELVCAARKNARSKASCKLFGKEEVECPHNRNLVCYRMIYS